MQFVWLLNTCFQAPSIFHTAVVGKPCKSTWPSEAGTTSHDTAALSYSRIYLYIDIPQGVCVDLINSSLLLLNYSQTSLQVAIDQPFGQVFV